MHYAALVRINQRARHLFENRHDVGDRKLALAAQPVTQTFALDEGHRVERHAVDVARRQNRHDVRML